jgi:hypothetical protein
LWKLKIQSKAKIFLWRALHGIFPLKSIPVIRHIGFSGQCLICVQEPEDVAHLLFQYDTARQIWSSLGITNIIDDALLTDRVGSAVLEHLLRGDDATMPSFNDLVLKETIGVASWYIRWIRRRRTHDETVPPIYKCKMPFLSITLNAAKVGVKPIPN